jgi:hypothetical protein
MFQRQDSNNIHFPEANVVFMFRMSSHSLHGALIERYGRDRVVVFDGISRMEEMLLDRLQQWSKE